MSRFRKEINGCLGKDGLDFLYSTIKNGKIRKEILKDLASELELMMIYEAHKNKDPFDGTVANDMFNDILDKVCVNCPYDNVLTSLSNLPVV